MADNAFGSVSQLSLQAVCLFIADASAGDVLKKTAREASLGADAHSVNCIYCQKSGFCFNTAFTGFLKQPSLSICSVTHLLPLAFGVSCVCSRGFVAFPGAQGIQGQQHKLLWHREPSPEQLAAVMLYGGDAGLATNSKPKG